MQELQSIIGGSSMKVVIDRFEGNYAVVEIKAGQTAEMPKVLLPKEAAEGDTIEINIRKDETIERKEKIEKKTKDLWE